MLFIKFVIALLAIAPVLTAPIPEPEPYPEALPDPYPEPLPDPYPSPISPLPILDIVKSIGNLPKQKQRPCFGRGCPGKPKLPCLGRAPWAPIPLVR
jgi:hypothetical protein